jgi:hypothetical protein
MSILTNATAYCGLYVLNQAGAEVAPHPAVIDFQQVRNSSGNIMNTFGGYRYYGGNTTMGLESGEPDSEPENPYAMRTNQAGAVQTHWLNQVQLDDYGDGGFTYQAPDVAMIYDKTANLIRTFWVRETVGGGQTDVMHRTLSSSMALGTRTSVYDCSTEGQVLSPCFAYDDSNYLHMWFVRGTSASQPGGKIYHMKSTYAQGHASHALVWDAETLCTPDNLIKGVDNNLQYWHINCHRTDGLDTVWLFPFCSHLTSWQLDPTGIYLLKTDINSPTSLELVSSEPVVENWEGAGARFDDVFVYQCAPVTRLNGSDIECDLFYAGAGTAQSYWIASTGFTSGTLVPQFKSTTVEEVGSTLVLTGWGGSTTYYKLDGEAEYTIYTIPLDLYGSSTFTYYSEDVDFTETPVVYNPGYVSAWTEYTTPFAIQDGTLEFYAVDASGNVETTKTALFAVYSGVPIRSTVDNSYITFYSTIDQREIFIDFTNQ